MLQNPCKTLGFKKNMVYKIPRGGGGKPYPASGLIMNIFYLAFLYLGVVQFQLTADVMKVLTLLLNFYVFDCLK